MLLKIKSLNVKQCFAAFALAAAIFSSTAVSAQTEEFRKPYLGEAKILPNASLAYVGVESYPVFKGNMRPWLKENVQTTTTRGKEGRAVIAFVINADGKLTSPYILRSSGNSILDKEALRLISILPNEWKPGTLNGRAVPVYSTLNFEFTKDGIDGGGC